MVLCHSVYGPCECEWVWLSPAAGADAADSQLAKYDCWYVPVEGERGVRRPLNDESEAPGVRGSCGILCLWGTVVERGEVREPNTVGEFIPGVYPASIPGLRVWGERMPWGYG